MKKIPPIYAAPFSDEEQLRVSVLKSLQILDTEPDACLQAMVELVALVTQSPIALISLVDENRQWFKASFGLATRETPRCQAFCGFTILQNTPFVVKDASIDPRLKTNPLVTQEPFIRAYLGVPIAIDSMNIGSLCVIDTKPREYGMGHSNTLVRTVRMIEEHIALRYKEKARK